MTQRSDYEHATTSPSAGGRDKGDVLPGAPSASSQSMSLDWSLAELNKVVDKTRSALFGGTIPRDAEAFAKSLRAKGIDVVFVRAGSPHLERRLGKLVRSKARDGAAKPTIYVSADEAPALQRLVLAHELGHLILHQAEEYGTQSAKEALSPSEIEAQIFVGELLMPRAEFRAQFEALDKMKLSEFLFWERLARDFGVWEGLAKARAGQLKLQRSQPIAGKAA